MKKRYRFVKETSVSGFVTYCTEEWNPYISWLVGWLYISSSTFHQKDEAYEVYLKHVNGVRLRKEVLEEV